MCLGATGVITAIRDDEGVPIALVETGDAGDARDAGEAGDAGPGVVPACLLTCQEAGIGDVVLVHSGYVLRILDPRENAP